MDRNEKGKGTGMKKGKGQESRGKWTGTKSGKGQE